MKKLLSLLFIISGLSGCAVYPNPNQIGYGQQVHEVPTYVQSRQEYVAEPSQHLAQYIQQHNYQKQIIIETTPQYYRPKVQVQQQQYDQTQQTESQYHNNKKNGGSAIVGTLLGGAIGSQVGRSDGRLAATAIGGAIGGVVGYGCRTINGGQIIGALAGGILGSTIGQGSGKVAATAIGSSIGAQVGNDQAGGCLGN
jgi:uncharacterized protein YcfJ